MDFGEVGLVIFKVWVRIFYFERRFYVFFCKSGYKEEVDFWGNVSVRIF